MKKFVMMFIIFTSLIFLIGFKASASEVATDNLPKPGVKPGNVFYGFDKFFENVALRLTFSDEKKAEKLSQIAEERLAELNALDSDKAQKYGDELFNEYGLDIEKAHLYVQQMAAEGKISDAKLNRIENRIQVAERKQEHVQERVSEEVRNQVQNAIREAKMSIFNQFDDLDLMKQLHEESGFGYGQLLKLQAISELSSTSIEDLLAIENAVTVDENNGSQLNITTIMEAKGITQDALHDQLKTYKEEAKTKMQNRLEEAKQNAKQRREEIQKRIKAKRNENNGNANKNND